MKNKFLYKSKLARKLCYIAEFFEHNVFGGIRAMIQLHKSDLSLSEVLFYTYIWKGKKDEKAFIYKWRLEVSKHV